MSQQGMEERPKPAASTRADPARELREAALDLFVSVGYAGTSLQQIGDAAGYAKSSVLYHYASKEALLQAALQPALQELDRVLNQMPLLATGPQGTESFIEAFIDFILGYRRETQIFVNQGMQLKNVPVMEHANEIIGRCSNYLRSQNNPTVDMVRFGVALGGTAYMLGAAFTDNILVEIPQEQLRAALREVMSALLEPAGLRLAQTKES